MTESSSLNHHTVESLSRRLQELEELVRGKVKLCRKEVMERYGISKSTLHDWLKKKILPEPVRMGGPRWPLSVLEKMEKDGQLPAPSGRTA